MVRPVAPAVWGLMFVILCCVPGSAKSADEDAAQALSGRGMHAYFSGNDARADDLFTQAIATGTQDPRPYFFRAACRMRMGREAEALDDIRRGAYVEAHSEGRFYDVDHSLERVQGKVRVLIEQARNEARRAALEARERYRRERYEQLEASEPDVLLKPVPTRPLIELSPAAIDATRHSIQDLSIAEGPAAVPHMTIPTAPDSAGPADSSTSPFDPPASAPDGGADGPKVSLRMLGSLFSRALTAGAAGTRMKALEGTLRKLEELIGGLRGPGGGDGP